jgi:hypothetical protein
MSIHEKFFSLKWWRHSLVAATVVAPMAAGPLSAQQERQGAADDVTERMLLVALQGTIVLDGWSDEPGWQAAAPLPMTMYEPTFQGGLTERTEIRITHDREYLYVAGRFFDSDPTRIRVNSLYRDRASGDDAFAVLIDPFDDNDTGLWFWTNPAGVRGDAIISGDAQGSINGNWNTHWDVATVRDDEGWFAEMRIPFTSLGFQARDGLVRMAVSVQRYIARKNERQIFPAIPPEFSYLRPSLARDAVLADVDTHTPVYATPYLLSGVAHNAELDALDDQYVLEGEDTREAGLDVKYNVTPNLTADFTVNTDFAQVEADDQQVNLSRFSLFFPEKRQFFQERSGSFDFFTGGSTRLFHSRRIGLHEGEPIRILGGARLVGRVGDWDLGFLDMQTARSDELPSENFGVLRLRRRVFNQYSTAGGMVTSRIGDDGSYNVAYGLDGSFRIAGDDYLTVKWAQSFDDSIIASDAFGFTTSGLVHVTLNRVRNRGFTYGLSGRWSGRDYRPEMGFVTRRDFSDFSYSFSYFHYPTGDGPFRRIDPFQLFGSVAIRNSDGSVESAFMEHDFDLQWKSGASLGLDLELYYEDLRQPLLLPGESRVPAGSYRFPRFEGDYSTGRGNLVRAGFNWGIQKFYDGWRANVGVGPVWNASRFLELSAGYQVNIVRFPDRNEGFDAHLLRLRSRVSLNTKLSVNAFVQFSNTADYGSANVRFRYNFREGNDLWVVYNHGINLDRQRTDPFLPLTNDRTMMVKYTHTFVR